MMEASHEAVLDRTDVFETDPISGSNDRSSEDLDGTVEVESSSKTELCQGLGRVACAGCPFLKLCNPDNTENFVLFEEDLFDLEDGDETLNGIGYDLWSEPDETNYYEKKYVDKVESLDSVVSSTNDRDELVLGNRKDKETLFEITANDKSSINDRSVSLSFEKTTDKPKIFLDKSTESVDADYKKIEKSEKNMKEGASTYFEEVISHKFEDKIPQKIKPNENFILEKSSVYEGSIFSGDFVKKVEPKNDLPDLLVFRNNFVCSEKLKDELAKDMSKKIEKEVKEIENLAKNKSVLSNYEGRLVEKILDFREEEPILDENEMQTKIEIKKKRPSYLELLLDDTVETVTTKGYVKSSSVKEKKLQAPSKPTIPEDVRASAVEKITVEKAPDADDKPLRFESMVLANKIIDKVEKLKKIEEITTIIESDSVTPLSEEEPVGDLNSFMELVLQKDVSDLDLGEERIVCSREILEELEDLNLNHEKELKNSNDSYKIKDVKPLIHAQLSHSPVNKDSIIECILGAISIALYNNIYDQRASIGI